MNEFSTMIENLKKECYQMFIRHDSLEKLEDKVKLLDLKFKDLDNKVKLNTDEI